MTPDRVQDLADEVAKLLTRLNDLTEALERLMADHELRISSLERRTAVL